MKVGSIVKRLVEESPFNTYEEGIVLEVFTNKFEQEEAVVQFDDGIRCHLVLRLVEIPDVERYL